METFAYQLDLVIARRRSLPNVLSTRSYHSAECDSDHALVCNQRTPRINTAGASDSKYRRKFLSEVEKALEYPQGQDAISRWNFVREVIHYSATAQSSSRKTIRVSQTSDIKTEVVDKFTFLGSTISINLSLDSEISRRNGKATRSMSELTKEAW